MATNELARRSRHLELLSRIGLDIASIFDLNKLLSTVAKHTTDTLSYDNCAIFMPDGEQLILETVYGFPEKDKGIKIPLGKGVVGRCAHRKEIINIGDVSRCSFYIPSGLRGVQSEVAVPIFFREHLLAVLTIESRKKNAFHEEDARALSILGSQLGVAIHNAKLVQSKHKEVRLLHRIGTKITANIDLDDLLHSVVNLISFTLGYSNCAIFLPSEEKLILKSLSRFPNRTLGMEIPLGEGIVGRSAVRKKTINIRDVTRCSFYIPSGLKGANSCLALPILYENSLLGVLATESRRKNAFGDEDIKLLQVLCSQVGIALKNAEMVAEIKKLAVTDSLTGLYNHGYFIRRLEQEVGRARRYKRELSLVLIDLDDFKSINDTFGHLKGDDVLIAVAQLILQNIRKSDSSTIMKEVEIDIPVRFGGEELMIIMPETPLQGAAVAAQRLRKTIVQESNRMVPLIKKDGDRLTITGSFGVASYKPDETSDELIKRVDAAMYEAKRCGKNRVCSKE